MKCHLIKPLLILILVPVIAVFTKTDVLDDEARNQLQGEEVPFEELEEKIPIRAKFIFEEKYLPLLDKVKHKPHSVIQLRGMSLFVDEATYSAICHLDMNKKDANCDDLILKTSLALNDKTLNLFCLSILRNNMKSNIKYVINQ